MKKSNFLFVSLLGVSILFSSCATIFTGTKDTIRFNSKPQGASVYIDGIEVCKTPCTTKVKRSLSGKMVDLKLDGYETRVIELDRAFNIVSILNLGGIWGWAIDAATGSLMKYDRKAYDIELSKSREAILENSMRIEVNTEEKLVNVYVAQN